MKKKYKLTDETIEFEGRTLYRIEALKDFYTGYNNYYIKIEKGDKGGFVQSEENLRRLVIVGFFLQKLITDFLLLIQKFVTKRRFLPTH